MALSSNQPVEVPDLDHTGTVGGNSERAAWNDSQRTYLLQQLCISPCGKKGRWSKDIWVKITESLKGKFPGSNFTSQQVKQQEQDLHKKYNQLKQILSRPGFEWDDKNCMLQASNNYWMLLEDRIRPWCRKRIPYYAALVSLYEGHDVGAQVESNSNPIQIGAKEETADIALQGSSEEGHTDRYPTLSSAKADEQAMPSSPVCDQKLDSLSPNHSHNPDFDKVFSPEGAHDPPLPPCPNLPLPADNNMIVPFNFSEIPQQLIHTNTYDEAAGFVENSDSDIANNLYNQMPLNVPVQQSNFPQFSHLAPNQPPFDLTSWSHQSKISAINMGNSLMSSFPPNSQPFPPPPQPPYNLPNNLPPVVPSSNLSENPYQPSHTETLVEAGRFPENGAFPDPNSFTNQSNQMSLNDYCQQVNFLLFSDLAPNQPPFDQTSPSQYQSKISANPKNISTTYPNNLPPLYPNNLSPSHPNNLPPVVPSNNCENKSPSNPNDLPPVVPSNNCENKSPSNPNDLPPVVPSNNCENKSPSNNDTDMGCNPSFLAPSNADRASDFQQPGKHNSFSNYSKDNPLKKVRGKRVQKKRPVAKSNFTPTKCIEMYYELPGFGECDLEHVAGIFRDDKNREFFVAFKKSDRAYWLQKMIDGKKARLSRR